MEIIVFHKPEEIENCAKFKEWIKSLPDGMNVEYVHLVNCQNKEGDGQCKPKKQD